MKVFIVSAVLLACAMAAPAPAEESTAGNGIQMALRYFGSCLDSDEMGTCFAVKGITALNRAARANNIEIVPGVTFARDPTAPVERMGKSVSENEIISSLPATAEDKSDALFDMAVESAKRLFSARSVQFKLPEEATETIARSLEEGRLLKKGKKLKKILGPLALAVGGKLFALLPLLLGGVALLAIKALIVSKIALVLAVVLAVKKFLGGAVEGASTLGLLSKAVGGAAAGALGGGAIGGGAGAGAAQGWSSGAGASGWSQGANAQYPYARSYDTAQDLAYSAQAPKA